MDERSFAALVVQDEQVAEPAANDLEIVKGEVTIRLDASTPAVRIAEIVSALNAV